MNTVKSILERGFNFNPVITKDMNLAHCAFSQFLGQPLWRICSLGDFFQSGFFLKFCRNLISLFSHVRADLLDHADTVIKFSFFPLKVLHCNFLSNELLV